MELPLTRALIVAALLATGLTGVAVTGAHRPTVPAAPERVAGDTSPAAGRPAAPAQATADAEFRLYLPVELQSGLLGGDVTLRRGARVRGELGLVEAVIGGRDVVYAIDWYDRLQVFDVADPERPTAGATIADLTEGGPYYGQVVGDRLYVTGWDLVVLDVADPRAPAVVGRVPRLRGDIAVAAGRAYVAYDREVTIVDVADPSAPRKIGAFPMPQQWDFVNYVEARGNVVYAACNTGLFVLDAGDPAHVRQIAQLRFGTGLRPLVLDGDRLYVGTGGDRFDLVTVDVSDPASPRVVATARLLGEGTLRAVHDGLLFVSYYHDPAPDEPELMGGLSIWDIRGAIPRETGRLVPTVYDPFGLPLAGIGDHAYIPAPLDGEQRGGIDAFRIVRRR